VFPCAAPPPPPTGFLFSALGKRGLTPSVPTFLPTLLFPAPSGHRTVDLFYILFLGMFTGEGFISSAWTSTPDLLGSFSAKPHSASSSDVLSLRKAFFSVRPSCVKMNHLVPSSTQVVLPDEFPWLFIVLLPPETTRFSSHTSPGAPERTTAVVL